MKSSFKVGETVKCIIEKALSSSGYGPNVKLNQTYIIKEIITTGKRKETPEGYDHIDIGLPSEVGSVTCLETGDVIPRGETVAWCHPSRFETV